MEVTIVTANIGGIDAEKQIPPQDTSYKRIYITEAPVHIDGNDRTKALYWKCQLYRRDPAAGIIIWLDAKVQPVAPDFISQILAALGDDEIAVLKHHERKCIYQEVDHIEHCMKKGNKYLQTRYATKPLRQQVEAYRYFGYPKNNGLNDCCIIAIRSTARIQQIFNQWWHDVYRLDGFDQIALQFYCWRAGVKIQPIVFTPGSFADIPHNLLK